MKFPMHKVVGTNGLSHNRKRALLDSHTNLGDHKMQAGDCFSFAARPATLGREFRLSFLSMDTALLCLLLRIQ
jgi:hypothetical protein